MQVKTTHPVVCPGSGCPVWNGIPTQQLETQEKTWVPPANANQSRKTVARETKRKGKKIPQPLNELSQSIYVRLL